MVYPVSQPFKVFTDVDGNPLEDGYIYIGSANQNPQSSPIQVYWDAAQSIPAAQPIRTMGGYPSYNGSPRNIYVPSDFSITVRNKNGTFVYTSPTSLDRQLVGGILGISSGSSLIGYSQGAAGSVLRTVEDRLQDYVSALDFIDPAQHSAIRSGTSNYDCTAGLNAALASGRAVYFPAGKYTITAPLTWYNNQRVVGVPSESYINWTNDFQQNDPTYAGMASVIQYAQGSHGAIFGNTPGGVSVYGMVFRVGQGRTSADVLMVGMGNLGTWENCKFENLATVFADPLGAYGAGKLTGNRFFSNGTIAGGALVDTVAVSNIFTSNGTCFVFRSGGGFFQLVGNRFEFNGQVIDSYQSRSGIVTGNLFDCHSLAAIGLYNSDGWQITGNKFNGNGLSAGGAGARSHIHLKGSTSGVTISGNEFTARRSDSGGLVTGCIIECESLSGKGNKFIGNSDEYGWITAPVIDTFSTSTGTMIFDTFTIPTGKGDPNTATDALHAYLRGINSVAIDQVRVLIKEARLITSYVGFNRIIMEGVGASPIAMGNSSGTLQCQGMNNITYGSVTYKIVSGVQYASAQPSGFQSDGNWPVGQVLFNPTPIAGAFVGWVKTAAGSPDTWNLFGHVRLSTVVASLPSAATVGAGAKAFVTDANSTTFGAAAAGGGANKVPVFSDGAGWKIG